MLGKILLGWVLVLTPAAWANPYAEAEASNASGAVRRLQENPGLQDYIEIALKRNRGLKAARLEWDAAMEAAPQDRALPNPVFRFGHFINAVETRLGPQERRLGLTQSFPWFGTLGLKGRIAEADAEAAQHTYQAERLEIARDVSRAYAEYYYLGSAIQITQSNIALLTRWEDILRSRYSVGGVVYSDLIKVQVELVKLEDALTSLEQQLGPRMTRLSAMMDLPPGTTLPVPQDLETPESKLDAGSLSNLLLQNNPELLKLAAMATRESLRKDLAGKNGNPNFALGVDWIHIGEGSLESEEAGNDALVATVAVEIPLWRGSVGAGKREAASRLRSADERLADRRLDLQNRLDELLFTYHDAIRKVELYRDSLIPKGDQALQAAFAAFESGDGGFLSVLDAERALLEFQLALERSRSDLVAAKGQIDSLTGTLPDRGAK